MENGNIVYVEDIVGDMSAMEKEKIMLRFPDAFCMIAPLRNTRQVVTDFEINTESFNIDETLETVDIDEFSEEEGIPNDEESLEQVLRTILGEANSSVEIVSNGSPEAIAPSLVGSSRNLPEVSEFHYQSNNKVSKLHYLRDNDKNWTPPFDIAEYPDNYKRRYGDNIPNGENDFNWTEPYDYAYFNSKHVSGNSLDDVLLTTDNDFYWRTPYDYGLAKNNSNQSNHSYKKRIESGTIIKVDNDKNWTPPYDNTFYIKEIDIQQDGQLKNSIDELDIYKLFSNDAYYTKAHHLYDSKTVFSYND